MVPLEKFDKSPVAASSQCVTQISVEYAQYTMIKSVLGICTWTKKALYYFGDDDDEVQVT